MGNTKKRVGLALAGAVVLASAVVPTAQAATASVGGGTWNYGSTYGIWPPKTCYSNYKHNYRYHSSSAIIAGNPDTGYASAGYWSYASSWAGAAYTCYTYWNTY